MATDKRRLGTTIVTSGEFRGTTILTPGGETHPMGSREKLAVFNMIADYLPGAQVLDAYAGSGALGIEALSRGADYAMFIDSDEVAVDVIRENLKKLGMDEMSGDVIRQYVDMVAYYGLSIYDVVFADPPYADYCPDMILCLADAVDLGGILVASTPEGPLDIDGFEVLKTRKYARAHITIYQRVELPIP